LPLVAIRRRAIVALLLLTALIGGSFAAQHIAASRAERSDRLVDVTQRQAMLTERIAFLAQALGGNLTTGQRSGVRDRLRNAISEMAGNHAALLRGMPAETDAAVVQAYRSGGLDTEVKDFLAHARAVAAKTALAPRDPDLGYVRAAALARVVEGFKNVATLRQVCSMMKWPDGHAYLLDRTNGVLTSAAIWHLHDPTAHEGFRRASEAIKLSPGVDLPGRVLVQRRPVWLTDVTEDHNFPRK